jgi:hypothetical protein
MAVIEIGFPCLAAVSQVGSPEKPLYEANNDHCVIWGALVHVVISPEPANYVYRQQWPAYVDQHFSKRRLFSAVGERSGRQPRLATGLVLPFESLAQFCNRDRFSPDALSGRLSYLNPA